MVSLFFNKCKSTLVFSSINKYFNIVLLFMSAISLFIFYRHSISALVKQIYTLLFISLNFLYIDGSFNFSILESSITKWTLSLLKESNASIELV